MLVNKASLTAVFVNLKTTFNRAFEGAPSQYEQTCMVVPSTSGQNNYDWIDQFPKMREWIGDKVLRQLIAHEYTLKNKPYEATVIVKRDDIEDDNLGIYGPMAQAAGFSAKQWPDELTAALKNNAFSGICFDGQYFYDIDHVVAGASVTNHSVVALSAASITLAAASYGLARAAIMAFKDDEGRPLGLIPDTLEVPGALETTGRVLLEGANLLDLAPNPYKGTAKLLVNPWLTSSTAWFLHCTNRAVKPFIFQPRKMPVFVSQINEEADDVFMRAEFKYGAEARGNAGYGLWQLSFGSTGAGA